MNKLLVICKTEERAEKYRAELDKETTVVATPDWICGVRSNGILFSDDFTTEEIKKVIIPYLVSGDIGQRLKNKQRDLRLATLEAAIRKHREATSHNMCWENDEELWSVLGDGIVIDHTPPPWCEFMQRCAAYRASKDNEENKIPTDKQVQD